MIISNEITEQTYLGMILLEPDLIKETNVAEEMFQLPEHQAIIRNMKEITNDGNPLDVQSLMIRMYENGSMNIVAARRESGAGYLTELANSQPTAESFRFYEGLLIDSYRVRESKKIASQIMNLQGAEGDTDIIFQNVDKIKAVLETGVESKKSLKDTLVKVYERIESGESMGIPTGYTELDRMTLGFHKKDLTIVAARPSVGKTAFCLNIGVNQAEQWDEERNDYKNHVHIFSLEMPDEQLAQRMISMWGRINSHNMRSSNLSEEEWSKLTMALGHFGNLDNLDIHDEAVTTVNDIRAKVAAAKRKHPNRNHIVIIDYLQLITYHGKSNETQTVKVGEISKALKVMAKELDCNVTALSQLSRGVESRQDKRPIMSDIRESGNIEQDADNIIFLYRDDYYDRETENKNVIELIIAKQRNGSTGTVSLAFIKEFGLFVNLERRFDDVPV
ncbi:replicative DNA helicase [Bacillus phage 031MP004]|nr:replicative DNA helicase [Bacillus phage 022DV001]QFG05466.1 replicative DNA helicase [Bacillus phage 031MP003]QFG05555.1 replicative DNA helicase [Bacillus phage 031MP002]QFG05642.1 replicative DNA helicase [Bacillus phage 031MP004]QFG05814.1 replicative DNA helicase [Bacillus phage 055SW001]